jgi:tRNA modification GTPase
LEAGQTLGIRLAQPGEFTQRAYLNGKLDLAQAEAVADLIDASTQAAVRSAGRSLRGDFSIAVNTLREHVLKLRMLVEATLDFPEEEIDFLQQADALGQLGQISQLLEQVLERSRQGALLREGMQVVLAGQPNVGKSSLLNALAGAELAIVTPVPGTTRDKVSQTIQIQGVPLHVVDTAGLRDAQDEVERIGIERSWAEIGRADAVLFVRDLTRMHTAQYLEADAQLYRQLMALVPESTRLVQVLNKCDAAQTVQLEQPQQQISVSAQTGQGLEQLRETLLSLAGWHAQPEGVWMARSRHVHALERTRRCVEQAQQHLTASVPALDLFAEELRLAHEALGEITGHCTADDLLGEIFKGFCIGK